MALTDSDGAPLVLDVRTPDEFAAGHVPGATNIPFDEIATHLAEVEPYRDRGVVVYCERGRRAGAAERELRAAGFGDVRQIEGHMSAWRASNLPVEK
ncbi:MAG: rhodanese-like domain-containing protein [Deltaproteobacteria bacterium]|nr:rhodanese-like domain-containing protein [Deltaproteobacteria bacterium]